VNVYFPLELPISEENRTIHDNFMGKLDEAAYFSTRRKRFASSTSPSSFCAYAKLFAMKRANEERQCNRTHKENLLRSRGELSIKLPTGKWALK